MRNSVKNWDDGEPLERSLPVVNGEFFQKLGRLGFLRRSLPVVNEEFCQELGWWGALRTLSTGSELRFQCIFSTILGPLERSLPVVNWDLNGFFKNRDDGEPLERPLPVVNWDLNWFFLQLGWSGALRTLATGSECSKRLRRSLPVRTLPISGIPGSERSKEHRSSQFLKEFPIHYW